MGVSEPSTWVLIRRYDKLETEASELRSSLHKLTVTSGSLSEELRAILFRLIDAEDDGTRVLKVRRIDNNLIPMSTLLDGSEKERPFKIDVVRVHQFCPVERRTILPGYIDALKSKFGDLESRVSLAEQAVPEIATARIEALKDATSQLANCVSFLDRRLDELAPSDWRTHICSGM